MTAEFLKQVNDVFDILNVRGFGTKVAAPLTADNQQQLDCMVLLKELSREWRVVGGRRPPCFEGLLQNSNAVMAMHADLVVGGPLTFLMTGRINQDCIENFFSQIRAKGGHRFNPSAKEFRYAYRNICSTFILAAIPSSNCAYDSDVMLSTLARLSSDVCRSTHPSAKEFRYAYRNLCSTFILAAIPSSNCAYDSDVMLSTLARLSSDVCRSTHREEPAAKRPRLESAPMVLSADDFETPSAVTNVLTYIGGYLVKKLRDAQHVTCERCLSALINTEMNVVDDGQLYLHMRAYIHVKGAFGGLIAPSPVFTNFLKQVENVFGRRIGELLTSSSLLEELTQHVLDDVPLAMVNMCSSHPEVIGSLLRLYLRCHLFYYFRHETRRLIEIKKCKRNRKPQALRLRTGEFAVMLFVCN